MRDRWLKREKNDRSIQTKKTMSYLCNTDELGWITEAIQGAVVISRTQNRFLNGLPLTDGGNAAGKGRGTGGQTPQYHYHHDPRFPDPSHDRVQSHARLPLNHLRQKRKEAVTNQKLQLAPPIWATVGGKVLNFTAAFCGPIGREGSEERSFDESRKGNSHRRIRQGVIEPITLKMEFSGSIRGRKWGISRRQKDWR